MKKLILISLVFCTQQLFAMSLDEFLNQVRKNHRGYHSLEIQKDASTDRKAQGDMELSPYLTLKGSYLDDKKPTPMTDTYLITHQQLREYSLGLGKKFSTGTNAQITASVSEGNFETLTLPATASNRSQSFGSLGIALSQSLWKNGFGSNTRLRWQREEFVEKAERNSYDLQMKQLLIEAENAFWDQIYLQEELSIRKESLERAKRIETWVSKRLNNGIGDRSDLLNAQGLLAARELQLMNTEDELTASTRKIADILELKKSDPAPVLKDDLNKSRTPMAMVAGTGGNRILRLDSYLSVLEAKAKAVGAEEAEDAMTPDLVLEGAYKTNSFEESLTTAANKITDRQKPSASVALKLTWLLDGDTKNSVRNVARSEALAAGLKKERKLLESDTSWEEVQRRHSELSKKIKAAGQMNDIQSKKAAAERDKLSKGRSITMQVITAEQDAAEAELTLTKLKAEQRKLEAQGRMFIRAPESI